MPMFFANPRRQGFLRRGPIYFFADVLSMDIRTRDCGSTFHVHTWKEYILIGTGDFTGTVCNYTFTGEVKENCIGLCYDMQMVSFLNNTQANLTVESETHLQVSGV